MHICTSMYTLLDGNDADDADADADDTDADAGFISFPLQLVSIALLSLLPTSFAIRCFECDSSKVAPSLL